MKRIIITILVLSSSALQAQVFDTLTSEQQSEDWEIFRGALEHAHGGVHWYMPPERWDSVTQVMEAKGWPAQSMNDFSLLIRQELTAVHCGHTWMNDVNGWSTYQAENPVLLPFNIYFNAPGEGVLYHDFTAEGNLPIGAKVTHLDGLAFSDVYRVLSRYVTADGYSEGGVMNRMRWNIIPRYAQHFGGNEVALTYEWEGKTETVMLSNVSRNTRRERFEERYAETEPSYDGPALYLEVIDAEVGKVGHLVHNSFTKSWMRQRGYPLPKKYGEIFEQVAEQELDYLILDLRDNGGGDDYMGTLLCRYLINQPFDYFVKMQTSTRRLGKTPGLDKANGLRFIGMMLVKDREVAGQYKWIWSKTLRTHRPKAPVFKGQLVVLSDGGTFSTATDVVSTIHNNREAVFVGQETGGGYYGNTSAANVKVVLPNSGLSITIPIVRYTNPVDKPEWVGRGIIPDVPVFNTHQDRLAGRDAMLEKAIQQFQE
ncbi:MAG TPA: hypothetical protein DCR93_01490 [Cytophagales bacterium]|nr:hypothetical protein [Cytophagales bacterium]HAP58227.1 hypothetical protein [Cytophagales bacterium]